MANFPLVLAIEPSLLQYAQANGFTMDHRVRHSVYCEVFGCTLNLIPTKYRNFVFRKMFEKPAIVFEGRADEIVRNVRELSRLDSRPVIIATRFRPGARMTIYRMFLSRTVAAEICMEVKQNESAYRALRRLDKEGLLRFELSYVMCYAGFIQPC